MSLLQYVILPLISIAIFLSFIRLLRGPSIADRVVALDLMTSLAIGIISVYAIITNEPALLDVALVFALLTFLGTIGFAYYVERRSQT